MIKLKSWLISAWKANVSTSAIALNKNPKLFQRANKREREWGSESEAANVGVKECLYIARVSRSFYCLPPPLIFFFLFLDISLL
jgi:hypothetical protein